MSKRIEGAAIALSNCGRAWAPTRRQLVLTALAGLGGIVLTGCSEQLPTYRYRLTVEVETPEGVRAGSSVIEVRTARGGGFPGPEAGGIGSSYRGQAVTVDLGERGVVFALLSKPDDADYAARLAPTVLLPQLVDTSGTPEAWGVNLAALKNVRGKREVPADRHPLFVRFRDISDPRTVEEVDGGEFDRAFGGRTRLRRVTVEITDDDVTTGISSTLPWWDRYLDRHFDGSSTIAEDVRNTDIRAHLSSGSFSTDRIQ